MKIKFLGTGTSTGNPEIGCRCTVCASIDKRDRRFRASVLVNIQGRKILIDCGPDFRMQILGEPFEKIDAVLLTHEHYDHVGGLDDLRPFCKFGDIDIYADKITLSSLRERMPYCFSDNKYPGIPILALHEVSDKFPFWVNDIEIQPILLMHHKLPILGYRIGKFAYLTDVKYIPDTEFSKLEGIDTLVINALRIEDHLSHQNLWEALVNIERINPRKAYLIHMSHHIGLHAEVEAQLPENVFLSYDGLEINL